jgi:hypothetical protein
MKYSSYKKSIDSKESFNSERKEILKSPLSFRKLDLSSSLNDKLNKLNSELNRLNEKREETLNRNFKYFSQKKESIKIIDFDIRIIKDKILILKEKLENPIIRISSIDSKRYKNIGNGVYIQRR